jgi:chorismate synthase
MLGSCEAKVIECGANHGASLGVVVDGGVAGESAANNAVVRKPVARSRAVMVFAFMRVVRFRTLFCLRHAMQSYHV